MSNPFKRASNNRFNQLLDDNVSHDIFKNKDKSKKKEEIKTTSSSETDKKENVFLKQSSKNDNYKNDNYRNDNYKNDNYRNDNYRNNNFSKKAEILIKEKPIIQETINIEENYDELFPTFTTNTKNLSNNVLDFTLAFKKIEDTEKPNKRLIEPGWTLYEVINGKLVCERGPLTKWEQKMNDMEKYKQTQHYLLLKSIREMEYSTNLNRRLYDSINGEGAYDEFHYVEPSYESEDEEDNVYNDDSTNDDDEYY